MEFRYVLTQYHVLNRPPRSVPTDLWRAKGMTRASYQFATTVLSNAAVTHVVLAKDRDVVVGWFRLNLDEAGTLKACGTWVDKGYRGKGIAKGMWQKAIAYLKPVQIRVDAVSDEGYQLICSLRAESVLTWNILNHPAQLSA